MDSRERYSSVPNPPTTYSSSKRRNPVADPVLSDAPPNSTLVASPCEENSRQERPKPEKLILLVEEENQSGPPLHVAIEEFSRWPVVSTSSSDKALSALSSWRNRVAIVLLTTGRSYDAAVRFINRVKELAVAHRFDCPNILVLSCVPLGPEAALTFEKLGAEYLLRQYVEPILESVKKIIWVVRKTKSLPTIAIYRRGGHIVKVLATNGSVQKALRIGPRLRELLEFFALHMHTDISTAMIADGMGVCLRSPKQYLRLLRQAWDRAFQDQPISLTGEQVFLTTKIPGGYVHRVNAHFDIVDEDEF